MDYLCRAFEVVAISLTFAGFFLATTGYNLNVIIA